MKDFVYVSIDKTTASRQYCPLVARDFDTLSCMAIWDFIYLFPAFFLSFLHLYRLASGTYVGSFRLDSLHLLRNGRLQERRVVEVEPRKMTTLRPLGILNEAPHGVLTEIDQVILGLVHLLVDELGASVLRNPHML